ncbi:MAG: radical SAM/SPASM domain-containing protein [Nannocystaceae bacterium]|nr:radical SAM protein [bacterium]
MSVLEIDDTSSCTIPRLDFELTPGCDHKCAHCYNVWTAEEDDPQGGYDTGGQLRTPEFKAMMTDVVEQTGAQHITITGGEPLLRKDALEIIEHACASVEVVTLITNGSHVSPETAKRFGAAGLRQVQLTLLAGDRAEHDRLKGAECFDDTIRAAVNLVEAGVPVQVCFVAMNENWHQFERVMELCYALGVRGVSYNRMSPTGGAIHHIARLMPTVEQIEANLETAERLGKAWGIAVSTAMPIPPCLIRIERYSWVRFGFCSTGSASPNIVIDGKGNVRSCNLAGGVMGNVLQQPWSEIYAVPYQREFKRNVPQMCRGCAYETSCQGGCKESGFATFGDHAHPEPLLWLAQNPQWREGITEDVSQSIIPLRRLTRPRKRASQEAPPHDA